MFSEDHDHLHCILRGRKRIVLVNTLEYPDVRTVRRNKRINLIKKRIFIFIILKTILPSKGQQRGPSINPDK